MTSQYKLTKEYDEYYKLCQKASVALEIMPSKFKDMDDFERRMMAEDYLDFLLNEGVIFSSLQKWEKKLVDMLNYDYSN